VVASESNRVTRLKKIKFVGKDKHID
jgi:hypothetical protein